MSIPVAEPPETDLILHYPWVRRLASVSPADNPTGGRHSWVFNLSTSAVDLIVDQRFGQGTPLAVELYGTARKAPALRLSARVNHCAVMPNGQWLAACDFTPPLAAGALETLRRS